MSELQRLLADFVRGDITIETVASYLEAWHIDFKWPLCSTYAPFALLYTAILALHARLSGDATVPRGRCDAIPVISGSYAHIDAARQTHGDRTLSFMDICLHGRTDPEYSVMDIYRHVNHPEWERGFRNHGINSFDVFVFPNDDLAVTNGNYRLKPIGRDNPFGEMALASVQGIPGRPRDMVLAVIFQVSRRPTGKGTSTDFHRDTLWGETKILRRGFMPLTSGGLLTIFRPSSLDMLSEYDTLTVDPETMVVDLPFIDTGDLIMVHNDNAEYLELEMQHAAPCVEGETRDFGDIVVVISQYDVLQNNPYLVPTSEQPSLRQICLRKRFLNITDKEEEYMVTTSDSDDSFPKLTSNGILRRSELSDCGYWGMELPGMKWQRKLGEGFISFLLEHRDIDDIMRHSPKSFLSELNGSQHESLTTFVISEVHRFWDMSFDGELLERVRSVSMDGVRVDVSVPEYILMYMVCIHGDFLRETEPESFDEEVLDHIHRVTKMKRWKKDTVVLRDHFFPAFYWLDRKEPPGWCREIIMSFYTEASK